MGEIPLNREGKKWAVNSFTVRGISETALLSVLIAAEKYIAAGLIASSLCLVLGIHSILNVLVAMTFRLVVALVWIFLGSRKIFYIFSGPLGTMAARGAISLILGKGFYALVVAAFPGMIFTMISSCFFAGLLERCRLKNK